MKILDFGYVANVSTICNCQLARENYSTLEKVINEGSFKNHL